MASVTDEQGLADAGTSPVDTQTIAQRVNEAWALSMEKATREAIDDWTVELAGYLELFQDEPLDAHVNPDTERLLYVVRKHLDREGWPDARTPAWETYQFMKATAALVRSLVAVYERVNEQR